MFAMIDNEIKAGTKAFWLFYQLACYGSEDQIDERIWSLKQFFRHEHAELVRDCDQSRVESSVVNGRKAQAVAWIKSISFVC